MTLFFSSGTTAKRPENQLMSATILLKMKINIFHNADGAFYQYDIQKFMVSFTLLKQLEPNNTKATNHPKHGLQVILVRKHDSLTGDTVHLNTPVPYSPLRPLLTFTLCWNLALVLMTVVTESRDLYLRHACPGSIVSIFCLRLMGVFSEGDVQTGRAMLRRAPDLIDPSF